MDIRKISVGPDYKSGAMHYIVIYIEDEVGIRMWKEFSETMPISIEYNINF